MPIFNIGAGEPYKTPVLNASHPENADLIVIESETVSATFHVMIAEAGVPAEYTYQWYWNGDAVDGATGSSYTRTGLTAGSYKVFCKVTSAAGVVSSRTADVTVTQHVKPVLNASYPADVNVVQASGASATFKVEIATAGIPAEYSYQWYVNGSAVSGATGSSYTRTGLTSVATYSVYCVVTTPAGTVTSRTATLTVKSYLPTYTYSGSHKLVDEGNGNWKIYFYTGGKLKFSYLGNAASGINVFCLGGGGGGGGGSGGGGGGGGNTTTNTKTGLAVNTEYTITIGGGGVGSGYRRAYGGNGGTTIAFGFSAAGGSGGGSADSGYGDRRGGNGGSGGGGGSSDSGNGGNGGTNGGSGGTSGNSKAGGSGQGGNTCEFGNTSATLYAGGGGGGGYSGGSGGSGGGGAGGSYGTNSGTNGANGATNYGGGGGGAGAFDLSKYDDDGGKVGGTGGSGLVAIRNKR